MITAQGVQCVVTLDRNSLVIIRFLGGVMSHTMRALEATTVTGVELTPPTWLRRGTLRLTLSDSHAAAEREEVV